MSWFFWYSVMQNQWTSSYGMVLLYSGNWRPYRKGEKVHVIQRIRIPQVGRDSQGSPSSTPGSTEHHPQFQPLCLKALSKCFLNSGTLGLCPLPWESGRSAICRSACLTREHCKGFSSPKEKSHRTPLLAAFLAPPPDPGFSREQ